MKFLLVICCVLSAWVQCDGTATCNKMRRFKVMKQWNEAFGFAGDRDDFNTDVWKGIFREIPESIGKFFQRVRGENVYSPEFRAHAARVAAGFDMNLSLLDEDDVLKDQLDHLKTQHETLQVPDNYFDVFRQALMDAVQKRIGRCFDQDAWLPCVTLIEDGIKG